MDMAEDLEVPLILGRPFIKIAKVIIDVDNDKLKVRVHDEEIIFNVFEAMKHPHDQKDCFRMDVLDEVFLEIKEKVIVIDPLEIVLTNQLEVWTAKLKEEVQKCLEDLNKTKEVSSFVAPKLELKPKNEEQE